MNYPCPECGYEGPHYILATQRCPGGKSIVECGDSECGIEFEVSNG